MNPLEVIHPIRIITIRGTFLFADTDGGPEIVGKRQSGIVTNLRRIDWVFRCTKFRGYPNYPIDEFCVEP